MKNNETLAQLISSARENKGLSQKGLALRAYVDLSIIEGIESGQELFLATSIRQKIAKALNLDSKIIISLEKQVKFSNEEISIDHIEELKLRILEGNLTGNRCPVCKSELICRVITMHDLEDNPVKYPKAGCSRCPFQIR